MSVCPWQKFTCCGNLIKCHFILPYMTYQQITPLKESKKKSNYCRTLADVVITWLRFMSKYKNSPILQTSISALNSIHKTSPWI